MALSEIQKLTKTLEFVFKVGSYRSVFFTDAFLEFLDSICEILPLLAQNNRYSEGETYNDKFSSIHILSLDKLE